jgi:hypothetical protein
MCKQYAYQIETITRSNAHIYSMSEALR